MAHSLRYVLQNASTGQYLTESGWSSNVADAKKFDRSTDLDNLPSGEYIQLYVFTVT